MKVGLIICAGKTRFSVCSKDSNLSEAASNCAKGQNKGTAVKKWNEA